jgi:fatty acid-binding protein DegV
MVELMHERNPTQAPIKIAITHVAAPEQAELLMDMVKESFELRETLISQLSPVLGVHTGPGMVGVNFFPVPTE